jgi:bis(5'-nucleosyl)-tetraphosphatase (symmetrical)
MADSNIITVLGNHDLYLLYLLSIDKATGSLKEVVEADSNKQIFKWLLKMPLMLEIVDEVTGNSFLIAHAGIPEIWSSEKTKELASEVTSLLQKNPLKVLQSMWGDNPNQWNEELVYDERCRIIINYLTRMRFVDKNCKLDLKNNTVKASAGFKPWFKYSSKDHEEKKQYYVFGHWAALNGQTDDPHFIGLDTGCVWKGKLTALRLNDLEKISVDF